jgi:hypothetical protein
MGWDVAGAIRLFRGRHPRRRSIPGASRHRYPPRDRVNSRTHERWSDVPVQRTHRRSLPARAGGRRLKKTRGRWRRPPAAARRQRERCPCRIPRYSPLRKLATARRQASRDDGLVVLSATKSALKPEVRLFCIPRTKKIGRRIHGGMRRPIFRRWSGRGVSSRPGGPWRCWRPRRRRCGCAARPWRPGRRPRRRATTRCASPPPCSC